tara:strand:- start:1073 stop:1204 length:132 start_codon:yes stop_codon:yes gene_type:complete
MTGLFVLFPNYLLSTLIGLPAKPSPNTAAPALAICEPDEPGGL